jgi:hypothetical protein
MQSKGENMQTFERSEMKLSNSFWEVSEDNNPYECELCLEYGVVCEIHSELEWDNTLTEINELADCLNRIGWKHMAASGSGGWRNDSYSSEVVEVNGENLRDFLFCYNTDMQVHIENFDNVFNGSISVKLSHHDRPMGETMNIKNVVTFSEEE